MTCKRKMLVKRCKSIYTAEITVEDIEAKQHIVTVFPNILETLNAEPTENLDEKLIVHKIVTKINKHN